MTRLASKKIFVEKYFRFWPFHEIFINHIKNIGWLTPLVFTESGTYYNTAKDFGQVKLETIDKEYQDLELFTLPTDKIKTQTKCPLNLAFKLKRKIGSRFPCQRNQQSSSNRPSGLEYNHHQYFMRRQTRNLSCKKHDPYAFLREVWQQHQVIIQIFKRKSQDSSIL